MGDLEVSATCPECGIDAAIRAGNAMDQIFCSECGWVTDPGWDGPDTRSELRDLRQEPDADTPALSLEDIQDAVEEVRRNNYGWETSDLKIDGEAVGEIVDFDVQTRAEAAISQSVRRYQETLERHLLGAWRAGYEAVDVVTPIGQPVHAGEDGYDPAVPAITGRVKVWESYPDDDVVPYRDGQRVERYDLRDVDPEEVRRLRGGDADG